jgi:glutathione S-transferase
MSEPTLFTFPPSLDSEFSRFVLHHYGFRAREERHVIVFQSVVTLVKAGTPLIPVLKVKGAPRLDTVMKIITYLEARAAPDRKLLTGLDPAQLTEIWQGFHKAMQTASTVFPYYYLLPRRDLMVRALSEGSPAFEVNAVDRAYPAFQLLLRLLLRLSATRAAQARDTIRSSYDRIDELLRDGREYLACDRFTLLDMSFAIAAAPTIWPDNYGGPLPPLARAPEPLQQLVTECRARPAGEFAMRIYRDHRG